MSQEYIWETFNTLFKTVHHQGKRIVELEERVRQLEEKLKMGENAPGPKALTPHLREVKTGMVKCED